MDLEILLVLAIGIGAVITASSFDWHRRLSRPAVLVLKMTGRMFGVAVGLMGVVSLLGAAFSGPGTERHSFVVPTLLVVSAATYLWGLETQYRETGSWFRRIGWVGAVLALSLTAISDLALLVSAAVLPTLLNVDWEGRGRVGETEASLGRSE
jgi:hypothetical protein